MKKSISLTANIKINPNNEIFLSVLAMRVFNKDVKAISTRTQLKKVKVAFQLHS